MVANIQRLFFGVNLIILLISKPKKNESNALQYVNLSYFLFINSFSVFNGAKVQQNIDFNKEMVA